MKILLLDAYFEPEQIAFTHLEKDLLEGLVKSGHEVEIICPTPTRGISKEIVQKYKTIKKETLYDGHVHITRFSAPQEGKNPIIRAIRYFWCNLRTYQIGRKVKSIDVVFANSTPPTQGWIAGKVAKKHHAPFIYSLQDVFPDTLVTTGLTAQGSILWKVGRKLEDATYKYCTKIIVISNSMKTNLINKGIGVEKLQVISNWIDLDKIHPVAKEKNALFDEYGINRDKFTVLYAGNFGAAQGAEIVLDVAEQFQDDPSLQFVIFGGGTGFPFAQKRAKKIPNVFIHPLLSQERISEIYSMGDVALITGKKGVGKSSMPSKTWSIMACNTPIIASFDIESELANIIRNSSAGFCVEAENVDKLSKAIKDYYWIKQKKLHTKDIREYVLKAASKKHCVQKYIEILEVSKF